MRRRRVYNAPRALYAHLAPTFKYSLATVELEEKMSYENIEADFHYENSGASHAEMQHDENCDWIYDNCTCGLIETENYDAPDDGDY